MNIRLSVSIILLLIGISCSAKKGEDPAVQKNFAAYLTGISLLQHSRVVPRFEERAVLLEQLQGVTSVDADAMIAYLTSLKNRPEAAMELYEEMKKLCSETSDSVLTIKNKE